MSVHLYVCLESILGIAWQSQMLQMSAVSVVEDGTTIALTGAALHNVGPIPRKKVPIPSLRYDCIAQSRAPVYFRPGPMTSVCKRDLITSVVSQIEQRITYWIGCQPHSLAGSAVRQSWKLLTMHHKGIASTREYPSY